MSRITKKQIQVKLDYINRCFGFVEGSDTTHISLQEYLGKTRVVKCYGFGKAETNLSMLGTKREAFEFLQGMATSLNLVQGGHKIKAFMGE